MYHTLYIYADLCVDLIAHTDSLPPLGGDTSIGQFAVLPGGVGLNCAAVAARLSVPTALIGLVGRDVFADVLLSDMQALGIGTAYVRRVQGLSGTVMALVTPGGERTFLSYRGANSMPYGSISPEIAHNAGDWLHLSGYSFQADESRDTAAALVAQAKANGARLSLAPSYLFASELRERWLPLLAELAFIFPNQEEARLMTGCEDAQAAGATLRDLGVGAAVITLGANGCYIDDGKIKAFVPPYEVRTSEAAPVDTTGAGDAFCGGFLAALLRGLDSIQAAKVGNAAAFHVIAHVGGHTGAPSLARLARYIAAQGDSSLAATLASQAL